MDELSASKKPWLSIAEETLDLDACGTIQGSCISIDSFEKLNQLGEGSQSKLHLLSIPFFELQ